MLSWHDRKRPQALFNGWELQKIDYLGKIHIQSKYRYQNRKYRYIYVCNIDAQMDHIRS